MRWNLKIFSQTALLACVAFLGGSMLWEKPFAASETVKTMRVGCVPEMDEIEVEGAWQNRFDLNPEQKKKFREEWVRSFGDVKKFVTPERVREISRWSRPVMERYQYVTLPNPEKMVWKTLGHDEGGRRFLLEAPLEILPSESGMKRELKTFALFSTDSAKIEWTLITIRSQLIQAEPKRRFWFF